MPAGRDLTLKADGVWSGVMRVVHVGLGPKGVFIVSSGWNSLPADAADHVADLVREAASNARLAEVAELLCAPAPAREAAR